jgi:hypothetical protein
MVAQHDAREQARVDVRDHAQEDGRCAAEGFQAYLVQLVQNHDQQLEGKVEQQGPRGCRRGVDQSEGAGGGLPWSSAGGYRGPRGVDLEGRAAVMRGNRGSHGCK